MPATRSRGTLMLPSRLSKSAIRHTPEPLLGGPMRQYVTLSDTSAPPIVGVISSRSPKPASP